MRFWDTSALAPLLVEERWSAAMRELAGGDRAIAVWWGTPVECESAVRRREREGELDRNAAAHCLRLLEQLGSEWSEMLPSDALRAGAGRLLAVHPLRAGDALQLAAAQTWRGGLARGGDFVCLDERLRDAAAREGFTILPGELD